MQQRGEWCDRVSRTVHARALQAEAPFINGAEAAFL
jgi:hypothetical protein